MAVPLIVAGVVIAVGATTAIIASQQGAKKSAKAIAEGQRALANAMNKAREELEKVGVPSIDSQKVLLQNPELVYQYSPELEQVLPLNETNLKTVQTAAKYTDAQFQALQGLAEKAQPGLNPEEQAVLNQFRKEFASSAEQARQNIAKQEINQGIESSGTELQKQLGNQFQNSLAAQEKYGQLGSANLQAKLDALNQMGGFATDIRGQEFGEKADIAQAQDIINRFNVANQLNIQQQNIANKNAAAQSQAELKQQLENQRAQTSNQQQQMNKELIGQEYQNQMNKYRALLGQTQAQATQTAQMGINAAQNRANQTAALLGLIGGGVKAGGEIYGKSSSSPKASDQSTTNTVGQPYQSGSYYVEPITYDEVRQPQSNYFRSTDKDWA